MTKEVLVSIYGTQGSAEEQSEVKLVTPGRYYKKNGKHYVLYDEFTEDDNQVIKNTLQFCDDFLSITKRGAVDATMVIEPEKSNLTQYQTQVGMLQISVDGRTLKIDETEESIRVDARYDMNINFENLGENRVLIDISSKNDGSGFSLVQ